MRVFINLELYFSRYSLMEKWFSGVHCLIFRKTVFVVVCSHITPTKTTVSHTPSQSCHIVKYKTKCKKLYSVI